MRTRTGYSFRKAVGHLDEVADRLKEIGSPVLPMTDTSAFGWVRWAKIAKEAGIPPLFGIEVGVSPERTAKKPIVDHWTFIPKTSFAEANKIVSISTEQFRYEPLLSYQQAMEADCVRIIGHRADLSLVAPDMRDTYVALGPSTAKGYARKAEEAGFNFLLCSDNRYTRPGDRALYETICGRDASTQSYAQHICSDDELRAIVEGKGLGHLWDQALANRNSLIGLAGRELPVADIYHPERPKSLREMCEEGAGQLGVDLNDPIYAERLERELNLIKEKDFEDYFYIIADVCQWARHRMVVGPARGSSCGSLVCYLLKITTVDPIPYGLIFERFIDINRDDLPDIDIDFSDQRRQLVFDYMAGKYGRNHVARLGTVALYKPKSCLNEAASALDIPPWKIDPVTDSIIERSGGDSRALQALEDTLNDTPAGRELKAEFPEIAVAAKMEGHPRHSSQHAAGIVLTSAPVENYIPIDSRTGATQCDKKDADDLNLLKIDALGLTQLSIFEDTLERLDLPLGHLDSLPLDDQSSFDILNQGRFSGIFQFEGPALKSVAQQIETNSLEDIVSMTALARPGPLNTGGTNHWIKVKNGKEPITYPHPLFEPYLKNTLGIVTYQEQVMQIGREIGDLTWGEVSALRKAMSKSLGKEFFDQYGDRWKPNAIKKGVPEDVANKVWDDLCAYGSWSFNRSHAVAYGLVSYYCCYLKSHHPLEFAASALSHMKTPEAQIAMLRELHDEGYSYSPVDKDLSTDRWEIDKASKTLVGPIGNVVGIGPKLSSEILNCRQMGEPLPNRAVKLLEAPKTKIDSLWPIKDRFEKIMPEPRERMIFEEPTNIGSIQTNGANQNVLVFCTPTNIKPKDENEDINVAKRGYALKGPTDSLNLRLSDDTGTIFAKVNRYDFEELGRLIINNGRPGKALYVIRGEVPGDFQMIRVKKVMYIGDMEKDDVQTT